MILTLRSVTVISREHSVFGILESNSERVLMIMISELLDRRI